MLNFQPYIVVNVFSSHESAEHEVSVNETVEIVEKLEVSEGSGNEIESMETHASSKLYKLLIIKSRRCTFLLIMGRQTKEHCFLAMFSRGGQTRKHCFLAMFPKDGQTRKHCFLAMFREGGQTRKHCFLAMFPEGGQTKKYCFLPIFHEGGQTKKHSFGNKNHIRKKRDVFAC